MIHTALPEVDVLFVIKPSSDQIKSYIKWLDVTPNRTIYLIDDALESSKEKIVEHSRMYRHHLGEQDLWERLAWQEVFRSVQVWGEKGPLQIALEDTLREVHLIASDYRNFGVDVARNLYHHLKDPRPLYAGPHLFGCFKDIPVLVCGAGPSLELILPYLKQLEGRVVLIAAGSALGIFADHGIKPSMGVMLDPHPPLDRLEKLKKMSCPIFLQTRTGFALRTYMHGEALLLGGNGGYPFEEWIYKKLEMQLFSLNSGWTVSNLAVNIAYHLGCGPIFLAGMDFSYPQGKIYAEGIRSLEGADQEPFKDSEGVVHQSRRDLIASAKWMEDYIQENSGRTWYNLSLGGASLRGIPKASVQQFMACVEGQNRQLPEVKNLIHKSAYQDLFSKAQILLNEIEESFQRCLDIIDLLFTQSESLFEQGDLNLAKFQEVKLTLIREPVFFPYIDPLWIIWEKIFASQKSLEEHPIGRELQKMLFFREVIVAHLEALRSNPRD